LIEGSSKEGGIFMWKNLYGSPVDNFGEVADLMDKNPQLASMWKG